MIRIVGTALLVLVIALVVTAATLYGLSERRLNKRYAVAASPIAPSSDRAAIVRGERFYHSLTCALCHAEDGGGAVYSDAGPIGFLAGPNLTRGRGGVAEQQFVTVMRTGQRPRGAALHEFMPWRAFRYMSDVELSALWRYLQSVPPKAFGGK